MSENQNKAYVKSYIISFLGLAVMAVISFQIGISTEPRQPFHAASSKDLTEDQRIAPVGIVSLKKSGDATTTTEVVAAPVSGESTYKSACFACHDTGAAGAPKKGDVAAWKPRIAQGLDVLLQHAMNGFNAMPARGGNPSITDEQLKATIEYIVKNSQ